MCFSGSIVVILASLIIFANDRVSCGFGYQRMPLTGRKNPLGRSNLSGRSRVAFHERDAVAHQFLTYSVKSDGWKPTVVGNTGRNRCLDKTKEFKTSYCFFIGKNRENLWEGESGRKERKSLSTYVLETCAI
jgi:hypothetical protein